MLMGGARMPLLAYILIVFIGTLPLAFLSCWLIEHPAMRLKNRSVVRAARGARRADALTIARVIANYLDILASRCARKICEYHTDRNCIGHPHPRSRRRRCRISRSRVTPTPIS